MASDKRLSKYGTQEILDGYSIYPMQRPMVEGCFKYNENYGKRLEGIKVRVLIDGEVEEGIAVVPSCGVPDSTGVCIELSNGRIIDSNERVYWKLVR